MLDFQSTFSSYYGQRHVVSISINLVHLRDKYAQNSQSVASGDYLRGLPVGTSLRSATTPRRSLRSPNPVYITAEDP